MTQKMSRRRNANCFHCAREGEDRKKACTRGKSIIEERKREGDAAQRKRQQ